MNMGVKISPQMINLTCSSTIFFRVFVYHNEWSKKGENINVLVDENTPMYVGGGFGVARPVLNCSWLTFIKKSNFPSGTSDQAIKSWPI